MFDEWQQRFFQMVGYDPTPEQWKIHKDKHRIKLVCGGVRGGKSLSGAMELASYAVATGGLYWLVGHDYEATKGEWEHLITIFDKLGMIAGKPSLGVDPGLMRLINGAVIQTKSAKYPRTLATVAPDFIILCEAAQNDYETYQRLIERIAEKRAHLYMSGTLEYSEDWYSEYYNLWSIANDEGASFSLPTWSNIRIFKGGRNDPEILRIERSGTYTKDRFMERYGGQPCPPANRVIPEFTNRLHVDRNVSYDPDYPVEIAVDPGYLGAHAVLALQKLGGQVIIFDEIYATGLLVDQIILSVMQRPWWRLVNGGAIDIAGKYHANAMPAPIELWRDKGHLHLRSRKINEEDGIETLRSYLMPNPITKQPLIRIHPKCKGLISEMGGCKSPVEGGGTWKRNELTNEAIDRNNHSAKALIYWLVTSFGFTDKGRMRRRPTKFRVSGSRPVET